MQQRRSFIGDQMNDGPPAAAKRSASGTAEELEALSRRGSVSGISTSLRDSMQKPELTRMLENLSIIVARAFLGTLPNLWTFRSTSR